MKNKKTALSLILLMVLAVTACAQQYDPESDFRVQRFDGDGGGVEIIAYLGNKKVVRIPPRINNQPVRGIVSDTFEGKQLTSVTIPNNVVRIETGAFANNQITSVTIPNSVTSLDGFENNQITSVTIPNGVTNIYVGTFANNPLTSITIPSNVEIDSGAFTGDFVNVYKKNNRAGGTYRADANGKWRKE